MERIKKIVHQALLQLLGSYFFKKIIKLKYFYEENILFLSRKNRIF